MEDSPNTINSLGSLDDINKSPLPTNIEKSDNKIDSAANPAIPEFKQDKVSDQPNYVASEVPIDINNQKSSLYPDELFTINSDQGGVAYAALGRNPANAKMDMQKENKLGRANVLINAINPETSNPKKDYSNNQVEDPSKTSIETGLGYEDMKKVTNSAKNIINGLDN